MSMAKGIRAGIPKSEYIHLQSCNQSNAVSTTDIGGEAMRFLVSSPTPGVQRSESWVDVQCNTRKAPTVQSCPIVTASC